MSLKILWLNPIIPYNPLIFRSEKIPPTQVGRKKLSLSLGSKNLLEDSESPTAGCWLTPLKNDGLMDWWRQLGWLWKNKLKSVPNHQAVRYSISVSCHITFLSKLQNCSGYCVEIGFEILVTHPWYFTIFQKMINVCLIIPQRKDLPSLTIRLATAMGERNTVVLLHLFLAPNLETIWWLTQ